MALSRSTLTQLFSPEWVAAVSPAPESAMSAEGEIYNPRAGEATWVAGVGMSVVKTTWYTGKMRVQPVRGASPVEGDWTQNVLVSVPASGPFASGVVAKVGMTLTLSSCPLNPELAGYVYTCVEIMDSSNPVERTLLFRVNHAVQS